MTRTPLQDTLARLSARSERSFLALAQGFPALMREMRQGLVSANDQLARIREPVASATAGGAIASLWDHVEAVLAGSNAYFGELSRRDAQVISGLKDGMNDLQTLTRAIDELREDALDMEVLAINAIVTARRLGERGRGFAHIASELQRLATETVEETKQLGRTGGEAVDALEHFRDVITGMEASQNEFYGDFERSLGDGFKTLTAALAALVEELSSTIDRANLVEPPLHRIMATIQIQDIIMQSISHVRTVAGESTSTPVVSAADGTSVPLLYLAAVLLRDVSTKLASAIDGIVTNIAELRVAVNASAQAADSTESLVKEIDARFERPIGALGRVTSGIETTVQDRLRLRGDGGAISLAMSSVIERLTSLGRIADRLYPLQVMSRIEVARSFAQDGERRATEGMEEFVAKLADDIVVSNRDLTAGLGRIDEVIGEHARSVEETVGRSRDMSETIDGVIERLVETRARIARELGSFALFSDRFMELVDNAERDVQELTTLQGEIDELIESLESDVETDTESAVKRELSDEVIRSFLDRFTIATHKHSAASIVGLDVDRGDDEGELTLF